MGVARLVTWTAAATLACSAPRIDPPVGVVRPRLGGPVAVGCTQRVPVWISTHPSVCLDCRASPYSDAHAVDASCDGDACAFVADDGAVFGNGSIRAVRVRALRSGRTKLTVHARSADGEDWFGSTDATFLDVTRVVLRTALDEPWRDGLALLPGVGIRLEAYAVSADERLSCPAETRVAVVGSSVGLVHEDPAAIDVRAASPGVASVEVDIGPSAARAELRVVSAGAVVGGALHRQTAASAGAPTRIDDAVVETLTLDEGDAARLVPVWALADGTSAVGAADAMTADAADTAEVSPDATNVGVIVVAAHVGRTVVRGHVGAATIAVPVEVVATAP